MGIYLVASRQSNLAIFYILTRWEGAPAAAARILKKSIIPHSYELHPIIKMRAEPVILILTASVAYAVCSFFFAWLHFWNRLLTEEPRRRDSQ